MCQLFIRTGIHFPHRQQALAHIGQTMLAKNIVHADYPAALLEREKHYPTGIALARHAVAIPHCDACYAKSAAIYLIRPDQPVLFQRADEDSDIAVSLIIALIMTNPQAQLNLLRQLFSALQHPQHIDDLLNATADTLGALFSHTILSTDCHSENL